MEFKKPKSDNNLDRLAQQSMENELLEDDSDVNNIDYLQDDEFFNDIFNDDKVLKPDNPNQQKRAQTSI